MIRATVLHPHAAAICSPLRWITGARPSETNWQSFQKVRLLGRLSARFRSASAVTQNIQKAPPQHRETAPPSQSAHSASNGGLQTSLEATLQEIQASPSFEDPDIGAQVKDPASGPIIHLPSDPRPWENEREYFKYRMRVAYDGTNYWGWQIQLQSGLPTVQGRIEEALMTITREPRGVLRVLAAGRTDAGVHARGQVAHFFTSSPLEDLESIHLKLNGKNIVESPYSSTKLRPKGVLPVDIRILELAPVTHDFHARFSAISKIYHYSIATKPVIDPLSRLYSAHVFYEVDIDRIKEGALHFVGEHDFAAFANFYPKPRRDVNADTVRTITRFDVVDTEEGVRLEIEGTGFLYRQVRNMVGLLVEIGRGQYEPSIVPKIMELRNRRLVPTSAPAHGLVMQSVAYPEELLKPPPGASAASTGRLVRKPSQKSKLEAQLAAI